MSHRASPRAEQDLDDVWVGIAKEAGESLSSAWCMDRGTWSRWERCNQFLRRPSHPQVAPPRPRSSNAPSACPPPVPATRHHAGAWPPAGHRVRLQEPVEDVGKHQDVVVAEQVGDVGRRNDPARSCATRLRAREPSASCRSLQTPSRSRQYSTDGWRRESHRLGSPDTSSIASSPPCPVPSF